MRVRLSLVRIRRGATAQTGLDVKPLSEPQPEPELEPAVVPLVRWDTTPRSWNIWELERLAETMNSDALGEERALLLVHLRGFADASGDLPVEFDALVRDTFGAALEGLVT